MKFNSYNKSKSHSRQITNFRIKINLDLLQVTLVLVIVGAAFATHHHDHHVSKRFTGNLWSLRSSTQVNNIVFL